MKGILGGNSEDSGEIWFGEEGLVVFYHGDTHGGVRGIIISCIDNVQKEGDKP